MIQDSREVFWFLYLTEVVLAYPAIIRGKIMTMPGLPKVPAAEAIDVDDDGNVVGIF